MTLGDLGLILIIVPTTAFAFFFRWLWHYGEGPKK